MDYRLHFTDAALAQVEQLGLDRDRVRTVINAGTKLQVAENHLVCTHKGLEVEVVTEGPDYEVREVRKELAWPSGKPALPYLDKVRGEA